MLNVRVRFAFKSVVSYNGSSPPPLSAAVKFSSSNRSELDSLPSQSLPFSSSSAAAAALSSSSTLAATLPEPSCGCLSPRGRASCSGWNLTAFFSFGVADEFLAGSSPTPAAEAAGGATLDFLGLLAVARSEARKLASRAPGEVGAEEDDVLPLLRPRSPLWTDPHREFFFLLFFSVAGESGRGMLETEGSTTKLTVRRPCSMPALLHGRETAAPASRPCHVSCAALLRGNEPSAFPFPLLLL